MKIICIGDSLTYGYGVRRSERWTDLLAAETGLEVVNMGVNGDTTGGMLARFRQIMPVGCDTAVFVMGGCNDIFYSGSDIGARANIGGMLHQILSCGAVPVVGIPANIESSLCPEAWGSVVDFDAASEIIEDYRTWLRKFSEAFSIRYIDFGDGWPEGHLADGLHPDAAGHRIIARKVAQCLKSII